MPITEKLAYEIYIIVITHVISFLILFSFSCYTYLRAKKTPLLYSFLAVVSTILLWMISKILKTVAPTLTLRWIFIVTQYLGAHFLGFFLVVFAYIYTRNKLPSIRALALLAIPPSVSFIITLTNPIHMSFYSYFDFYKDRFGSLFYLTQGIQYTYWVIGILMLSKDFTTQQGFHGKKKWAVFFSFATLIPVVANFYYIFFKMDILEWVFPFPVFDFTPIAASFALILFTLPALTYRFFDISPISYERVFKELPRGIVFLNKENSLYGGNHAFYSMFDIPEKNISLTKFTKKELFYSNLQRDHFLRYINEMSSTNSLELLMKNGSTYKVSKKFMKRNNVLLYFTNISEIVHNRKELELRNSELSAAKEKLNSLVNNIRELAITRTKEQAAQNMHDILGHSLTVVIGITELAAIESDKEIAIKKLTHANELLLSSLNDLKNALAGKDSIFKQTSLIKAIRHLKNDSIDVDFSYQGLVYELNNAQTEAIFRLCQESITNAIKHGLAEKIHLILRYRPDEVEVFAIDNGSGCSSIVKSYGLSGIETRIQKLSGKVEFGSDGVKGFSVHAVLPKIILSDS